MTTPFDSLPVELQDAVIEMRQRQLDKAFIDDFIERMLHALGVKSNRVQVEVWEMEERLSKQLDQIGHKLQIDLQTQHGATNAMLVDVRSAQMTAHPQILEARQDVADLKKLWSELDSWRSRVEATLESFFESREESKAERAQIQDAIRAMDARHGGQIAQLLARMAGSEHDRVTLHELVAELFTRLGAIEGLLEVAGEHDRREAGS